MPVLIFDVETTGFYNPKIELTSKAQARVVQLAAIKIDVLGEEIKVFNTLIKPKPWYVMADGAYSAHGIDLGRCEREGKEQTEVIKELEELLYNCDTIVAHNIAFDGAMLAVEYANAKVSMISREEYCTMERMTPICKLPHARKNSFGQKYKWPKLIEAYKFIFKKAFEGKEHDGLSDARACKEIYQWLMQQNSKVPFNPLVNEVV